MSRETEPDWDKELAEDCKAELDKYGRVQFLKVEKETQVCRLTHLRSYQSLN